MNNESFKLNYLQHDKFLVNAPSYKEKYWADWRQMWEGKRQFTGV